MAVRMERWSFEPPPRRRVRGPCGSRLPRVSDEGTSSVSSNPPAVGQIQTTSLALKPNIIPPSYPPTGRGSTTTFYKIQTASVQHSSTGPGFTNSSSQFELAPVTHSPSDTASSNTLHQIQGALVQHSLTSTRCSDTSSQLEVDPVNYSPSDTASTDNLHHIQRAPNQHSPTDTGSTRSSSQLEVAPVNHPPSDTASNNTLHQIQRIPNQHSPTDTGSPNSSDQLVEFRWKSPWIFSWNMTRLTKILTPPRKRVGLLLISTFLANVCLRLWSIQPICNILVLSTG